MTPGTDDALRDAAPDTAAPDTAASDIRVLSGEPTPEELAAVTAVVTGMMQELSDAASDTHSSSPSAWERSRLPIRGPLPRGANAWRGFSG